MTTCFSEALKEAHLSVLAEIDRLRDELTEEWTHRHLRCPCAEHPPDPDQKQPATLDKCTCGLKEALYG